MIPAQGGRASRKPFTRRPRVPSGLSPLGLHPEKHPRGQGRCTAWMPETVSAEAKACHRRRVPSRERRKTAGAGTGACAAAEDKRDGERQTPRRGTSSDRSPEERLSWRSRSPRPGALLCSTGTPEARGSGRRAPPSALRAPRVAAHAYSVLTGPQDWDTRRPRTSPASGSSWPARPVRARAPPAAASWATRASRPGSRPPR